MEELLNLAHGGCEIMKRENKIQKTKVERKITYADAARMVNGQNRDNNSQVGKSVKILRDTGSVQSLICEKVLPPAASYKGANILVRGIGSGCLNLPLHDLYLRSGLITGPVTLAVCAQLSVDGVDLILENYLAGQDVFPRPLVSCNPNQNDCSLPV